MCVCLCVRVYTYNVRTPTILMVNRGKVVAVGVYIILYSRKPDLGGMLGPFYRLNTLKVTFLESSAHILYAVNKVFTR